MISVIVPVYNVENYVGDCLHSLVRQTYRDLEIIIINDGSTDGSLEICKAYERVDDRIVLLSYENGGLSEARNRGLSVARGEYISFVDSDDWLSFNFYEELLNSLTKNDADIALCGYYEEGRVKRSDTVHSGEFICTGIKALYHTLAFTKGLWFNISVWNKLYKRELISGLRFSGRMYEDIMYNVESMYRAKKVVYLGKSLYHYRLGRSESIITNRFKKENILTELERKEERLRFFREKNEMELAGLSEDILIHDKLLYYGILDAKEEKLLAEFKDYLMKVRSPKDIKNKLALLMFKLSPRSFRYLIRKKYRLV